eukprot:NODE_128_length_18581_cov_0.247538.p8 type:complete len:149 gc:universal NODE_128_length_18581_cov_0.247538:10709-11155(+)
MNSIFLTMVFSVVQQKSVLRVTLNPEMHKYLTEGCSAYLYGYSKSSNSKTSNETIYFSTKLNSKTSQTFSILVPYHANNLTVEAINVKSKMRYLASKVPSTTAYMDMVELSDTKSWSYEPFESEKRIKEFEERIIRNKKTFNITISNK